MDPNIIVESLHRQLNQAFHFPHLVSIICFSRAIRSQAQGNVKFMRYESNDYDNEECLKESIEWCQKSLEHNGNMVDVVYINEVGFNLYLTRRF